MAQQSQQGQKLPATNDVYTLLLIVATVFLLGGTVYLAVRSAQLFGSVIPMGGG